jgi:hypothetical protein
MGSLVSFLKDNWPALAGVLYFAALIASHLPETNPAAKVAKWLLTGGVLKKPADS